MMRPLACAAVTAACCACSVGFGSSYVGQWRAREVVDYEVCVEDSRGQCESTHLVTSQHPERRFWGVVLNYPAIGVARVSTGGEEWTAFRGELSTEYLEGRGRLALGGRLGVVMELGDKHTLSVPALVIGHYGISERFSAYAGAGYTAFSRFNAFSGQDGGPSQTSHLGWRGLAGLQIVHSVTQRESRAMWIFEVDQMASRFGDTWVRSLGLMVQFGVAM